MPKTDPTDKVRELHDRLVAGVEDLVNSDRWLAFLATAARFHRYSAINVLLISLQAPHATRVGGYRRWQSLGRQVRKGERGIAIFAPCVYRRRPLDDAEAKDAPELAKVLTGFRLTHVWDISQTDGDPLPDVSPQALRGHAPGGLWDAIAAQIAGTGYTLERGDCGEASGRTHFLTRRVVVREDVDDAEATCTLIHELAHVLLHDPADPASSTQHRGTAEVERRASPTSCAPPSAWRPKTPASPTSQGGPSATSRRYARPPSASSRQPDTSSAPPACSPTRPRPRLSRHEHEVGLLPAALRHALSPCPPLPRQHQPPPHSHRPHRAGNGARLVEAVTQAGIGFVVARTWPGGRDRERQLKKQGGHARLCPNCKGRALSLNP